MQLLSAEQMEMRERQAVQELQITPQGLPVRWGIIKVSTSNPTEL